MVDTLLVPARFVSIDKTRSATQGGRTITGYRLCYNISLPDPATHAINHMVVATEWTDMDPVPAYVLPSNDVSEVILDQTQKGYAPLIGLTDQFVPWLQTSIGKQVLLVINVWRTGDPSQNQKVQDIMRLLRAGQLPPAEDSFQSYSGPKIGGIVVLTPDQVPAGAK
jgi:hypothetical protein